MSVCNTDVHLQSSITPTALQPAGGSCVLYDKMHRSWSDIHAAVLWAHLGIHSFLTVAITAPYDQSQGKLKLPPCGCRCPHTIKLEFTSTPAQARQSNWMFVANSKKLLQGNAELSHSWELNRPATPKHNMKGHLIWILFTIFLFFSRWMQLSLFWRCFMFELVHKLKEELSTSTQTETERCTKEVKIEHLSFFFSLSLSPFKLCAKESWCCTWTWIKERHLEKKRRRKTPGREVNERWGGGDSRLPHLETLTGWLYLVNDQFTYNSRE